MYLHYTSGQVIQTGPLVALALGKLFLDIYQPTPGYEVAVNKVTEQQFLPKRNSFWVNFSNLFILRFTCLKGIHKCEPQLCPCEITLWKPKSLRCTSFLNDLYQWFSKCGPVSQHSQKPWGEWWTWQIAGPCAPHLSLGSQISQSFHILGGWNVMISAVTSSSQTPNEYNFQYDKALVASQAPFSWEGWGTSPRCCVCSEYKYPRSSNGLLNSQCLLWSQ